MTDKHLQFLGIAALVTFIIAGFLYSGITFSGDGFQEGSPLIQGLDTSKIGSISIIKGAESTTLVSSENGFLLKEMSNYPASLEKINSMVIAVLDARLKEKVTESEGFHQDYGVDKDNKTSTVVTFYDDAGKELSSLVLGNKLERGNGIYLRRANENTVYATMANLMVATGKTDYLETKIFDLEAENLRQVEVSGQNGSYQIHKEGEELIFDNLPKGKTADENELQGVFEALADISFTKATPAADLQPAWDQIYKCTLESGMSYLVRTAVDGENILLSAQAMPPQVDQISIGNDDKDDELKKKEAILLDVDKSKSFNTTKAAWIYTLKKSDAEPLRKKAEELFAVEEKEEKEE